MPSTILQLKNKSTVSKRLKSFEEVTVASSALLGVVACTACWCCWTAKGPLAQEDPNEWMESTCKSIGICGCVEASLETVSRPVRRYAAPGKMRKMFTRRRKTDDPQELKGLDPSTIKSSNGDAVCATANDLGDFTPPDLEESTTDDVIYRHHDCSSRPRNQALSSQVPRSRSLAMDVSPPRTHRIYGRPQSQVLDNQLKHLPPKPPRTFAWRECQVFEHQSRTQKDDNPSGPTCP